MKLRRAPDFIIGAPDRPYLHRWWVIPRNRFFNIYLHRFLRSDDDRALHDHPWVNLSVLLSGQYLEHRRNGEVLMRKPWRPWAPWRLTFRFPTSAHRIELLRYYGAVSGSKEAPVWTLFITGPKVREWGFWCPRGWVPWQRFVASGKPGEIGAGCDAEPTR